MTLHNTVPATAERDPSVIPTYLQAFHRYLDSRGMDVRQIRMPVFLEHHARCEYEPFRGWNADCLFWGVWSGDEMVATWAAKPYLLLTGETLRQAMEARGLYTSEDESWRLDGTAFTLAEKVTDMAVFEGGLCMLPDLRESELSDFIIREMPLYARASAVDFWDAPWVWYMAKKPGLARRFRPEHLGDPVIWTKRGEIKDDAIRYIGVSSAEWIVRQAEAWAARQK